MNYLLTPTAAAYPLGEPSNRRLLRLDSGPSARRLAALIQSAPNTISLLWSDYPYTNKSPLQTIATNAANSAFDCCINSAGDIYVLYSEQSTGYLICRKLTFADGAWSIGNPVTVCDTGQCVFPSVAIEPGGKLWVAFARYSAPNHTCYVKSSIDGGATWGTGPTDTGEIISDSAMFLSPRLLCGVTDLLLLFAYGSSRITYRTRALNGSTWSSETTLATSGNISTSFDASLSPAGALGLAFLDGTQLRYREFDGVTWSPAVTIATTAAAPQVIFRGELPVIIFLAPFEGAQMQLTYAYRSGATFTAPAPLDLRSITFDSVILYDQSTASFADLSSAASDPATADVYHPASFALVKNNGDALYLGMDRPFRYLQFNLFTPGVGGTVAYSFWDGSTWTPFTPAGGPAHLTAATTRVVLWDDYLSIPAAWQKSSVGAQSRFWVRIDVTSSYTITPVASRISAISELTAICCVRN